MFNIILWNFINFMVLYKGLKKVPMAGLEPARITSSHFECDASANSATSAKNKLLLYNNITV